MFDSDSKVFIIAEAGSNWRMGSEERDLEMAKKLIDVASDAQADAIKFQTYRADKVYVKNAGDSNYLKNSGFKKTITEIFEDLAMPYEMIPLLAEYCKEKKIQFMSTPFSVDDAKAIDPFVKIHKIASYEISHPKLIEFVAKTSKPLILSTGAATIDDIKWAVEFFKQHGGNDIALLQTTAKYPAPLKTLNLNVLKKFKEIFNVPVGLSDHSLDPVIGPITAVSLGAKIIEKHFTISKKLPGPDHSFALMPNQLKLMIRSIRNCEECLGSGEKKIQEEEIELREYAQRSIQAIKSIKKGEIFEDGQNIDILRSGNQRKGVHPKFLNQILGKKATRDIPVGDGIVKTDYE